MKNGIIILFLVFSFQSVFSQIGFRKMIHGQVINDSIKTENVVVFNVNSESGKVVRSDGSFEIKVREKDTLIFSSLLFKSKKIILNKEMLSQSVLIVNLDVFEHMLEDVVIESQKEEPMFGDTQKIVDRKYVADYKTSPKNEYVYTGEIIDGIDFIRLSKDVMKMIKKKDPDKSNYVADITFTEFALQKIEYNFYKYNLKIPDDEIKLFLVFCENDPKSKVVLKSKSDFELMDFMIVKDKEFKAIENLK